MKRILAMALSVLLIAGMAIGGSVAYLTSTDNDTNTFTMGDVEIVQYEKDSAGNTFANNQRLLPSSSFKKDAASYGKNETTGYWSAKNGEIDKVVTVENTGDTSAYVRTIFAFEDTADVDTDGLIIKNWKDAENVTKVENGKVAIDGVFYNLYTYTYPTALEKGKTTDPSLMQIAMAAEADNAVVDAIAAIGDYKYTVLVATQAVQAENMKSFNDASAALDAAFYPITSENNPWTKGETDYTGEDAGTVVYISSKEELTAKLGGTITEDTTFVLTADIDMGNAELPATSISNHSYGYKVKFDGGNHTISNVKLVRNEIFNEGMNCIGLFTMQGTSAQLTVENLTLKNVTVNGTEENSYVAAIVGYVSSGKSTVTLNNVDVYDSKITSTANDASVFVGYTMGKVTLTDCNAINCTIKGVSNDKTGTFVATANGTDCVVTINNCVNNAKNGHTNEIASDVGRKVNNPTVNGTGTNLSTATDDTSLATALSNSGTTAYVQLSANTTYTSIPNAASGKTITFVGAGESTVIDLPNGTGVGNTGGTTLHFENLTIKMDKDNYEGFLHAAGLSFENCKLIGLQFLYAPTVDFTNCVFDSDNAEHNVWTYGAEEVNFTNCTFNYNDRAVNCYCESGTVQVVNFKNCTFNSKNASSVGAVEINSCYFSTGITVNMDNCKAPANGMMVYVSKWDTNNGAKTTINVNGVKQDNSTITET